MCDDLSSDETAMGNSQSCCAYTSRSVHFVLPALLVYQNYAYFTNCYFTHHLTFICILSALILFNCQRKFLFCYRRQSSSESGSKKLRKSKSANGGTFSHHGDPHHQGGHIHDKDYYDRAHIRTDPAGGGEGGEYYQSLKF